MKTLAIYQLKGGVGKTSTAVNFAALAAAQGLNTLLWDLDPQGAATWLSGVDAELTSKVKHWVKGKSPLGRYIERAAVGDYDVLPAAQAHRLLDVVLHKVDAPQKALKRLLQPFSEQYQLVILDAPPSMSTLADNVLFASDKIVLPVVPGFLAQRTLEQVAAYMDDLERPRDALLALYTMVDRRRQLHRAQIEGHPVSGIHWVSAQIPYASSVERMGLTRRPLMASAQPQDPARLAYERAWNEVWRRLSPR